MTDNVPRPPLPIIDPKFDPFALAIGQMTLTWNDLHEALGALFIQAMAGNNMDRKLQCASVWGAVTSDRQKRQLLEAAINCVGEESHRSLPQLANDVLWIIGRANSLEDKRNNVIHSPLGEITSPLVAALSKLEMGSIHPAGTMNDRAWKLSKATTHAGKDLLTEIVLYRDYASALAAFADSVLKAWRKPENTWPEKPALPPLKDKG